MDQRHDTDETADRAPPAEPGWRRVIRWGCRLLALVGCLALGVVSLGFTNVPWRLYSRLGQGGAPLPGAPDWIVVLGGGGIPSESGLIRCYYGAEAALRHPAARIMVCLPADGDPDTSSVGRMKQELVLRGVEAERIKMEARGRSTREQALRVADLLGPGYEQADVLIVTSVEHVLRACLSFQKAGFQSVSGRASFPVSAESTMRTTEADLGGGEGGVAARAVQESITLRYAYWNQMHYLGRALREGAALAYYRWRGWI